VRGTADRSPVTWPLWVAAFVLAASGCAKAPFTSDLFARYSLTRTDLARIQFFTSEPVILQRETSQSSRSQRGDELVVQEEQELEEVEVSERTPCVLLRAEGDYLLLGFSAKDERAALWFRAQPNDETADSGHSRRYVLVALDNAAREPGPFAPHWSKGYLVSWSGKKYHVISGRTAYLLYDRADNFERHKVAFSAPGWRVSERRPPLLAPSAESPPSAASEPTTAAEATFEEP
jgi:hypothetical protein